MAALLTMGSSSFLILFSEYNSSTGIKISLAGFFSSPLFLRSD
jgi:hypothetical protein